MLDPVITVAALAAPDDNAGLALGVQWFRDHENQSLTPEVALDAPGGTPVWGASLRYQIKTGPRSFFDIRGIGTYSRDRTLRWPGLAPAG